jgi:NaMN:DMB phosphoribosyltransferase
MKRVRTYRRSVEEARAALEKYPLVITRGDRASMSLAIGLLEDLTAELPAIKQREKARRERIQWVYAGQNLYVARVGQSTYRYSETSYIVTRFCGIGWTEIGKAGTSIESATRLLRRLRKAGKL